MKKLLGYDFEFVQDIQPVLDRYGRILEYSPQGQYDKWDSFKLNKYGSGTFCRFSIHPKWSGVSGVYAVFIDDKLAYIGQASDFAKRFNMGYGNISPRNCYIGGQSTNCKINKLVLNSIKAGKRVSVYFHITNAYNQVESELIKYYKPPYNDSLAEPVREYTRIAWNQAEFSPKTTSNVIYKNKTKNPSIAEVRKFIQNEIKTARAQGKKELLIRSGDIHKRLNMSNAYPTVCSAMRTLEGECKYEIVEEPRKGNGSRLVFRYIL